MFLASQCFIILASSGENTLPTVVMAGHILDVSGVSVYS